MTVGGARGEGCRGEGGSVVRGGDASVGYVCGPRLWLVVLLWWSGKRCSFGMKIADGG